MFTPRGADSKNLPPKTQIQKTKTMKKTLLIGIIAPALSTGLAHGATTTFGSDNDGLGGFTNSAETGTES